jgi:TonB family protein
MHSRLINRFPRKSFLVAVILHLLFLLSFVAIITIQPTVEPKLPDLQNIPSYIYNGAIQPTTATEQNTASNATINPEEQPENSTEIKEQAPVTQPTPHTIYTKPKLKRVSAQQFWGYHESVMDNSRQVLRQNRIERAMNKSKDPEPILLVGDANADANPLVKLMARALSRNFQYPKIEGNFGIHGKVLVQLTFSPDGYFSDPEIIESSNNDNFDAAALYAINKAPKVIGANRYLSAPKSYVVGFIFN